MCGVPCVLVLAVSICVRVRRELWMSEISRTCETAFFGFRRTISFLLVVRLNVNRRWGSNCSRSDRGRSQFARGDIGFDRFRVGHEHGFFVNGLRADCTEVAGSMISGSRLVWRAIPGSMMSERAVLGPKWMAERFERKCYHLPKEKGRRHGRRKPMTWASTITFQIRLLKVKR